MLSAISPLAEIALSKLVSLSEIFSLGGIVLSELALLSELVSVTELSTNLQGAPTYFTAWFGCYVMWSLIDLCWNCVILKLTQNLF